MKRAPLSEAQRRVMGYLTHAHGNYAVWMGQEPKGWFVFNAAGEGVMERAAHTRTVQSLEDLGLLDQTGDDGRLTASAEAWALAHKGELR